MGEKPKPIGDVKRGYEVVDLRIALDGIYGVWKCPDCGRRILHSYFALTDAGSPICDCSDVEMELESTTAQVIRRKGKREEALRASKKKNQQGG